MRGRQIGALFFGQQVEKGIDGFFNILLGTMINYNY
jgi:hypothetical protein